MDIYGCIGSVKFEGIETYIQIEFKLDSDHPMVKLIRWMATCRIYKDSMIVGTMANTHKTKQYRFSRKKLNPQNR